MVGIRVHALLWTRYMTDDDLLMFYRALTEEEFLEFVEGLTEEKDSDNLDKHLEVDE